jgi:hypothetical protein
MRDFTVRFGNYKGVHKIYDSPEEATKYGIKTIVSPWWSPDVGVGSWVVSDDGYVIQCLNRSILRNRRHRSGQFTDHFRFCNGSCYVYHDKHGERHIKNFYAAVANSNKNSLGSTPSMGRFLGARKKEFVLYVQMGFDLYTSYIKAFRVRANNPHIDIQVQKLLSEKLVREALMEAIKPMMQKIQAEVIKLSNSEYNSIEELLIKRTAKLIVKEIDDPKTDLTVLKFAYEFLGKPLGLVTDTNTAAGRKELADAEFEVIRPPELGINTEA